MHVSTKGRYGLRILLDLALHQDAGPVILREIARRQRISQKYLWQVINPLKRAGLVASERGAHGGYELARPPEAITVLDVVRILEGPVSVVHCVSHPDACDRSGTCTAREAWVEIEGTLTAAMQSITLKTLVERHLAKLARGTPTYEI